MRALFSSGEYR